MAAGGYPQYTAKALEEKAEKTLGARFPSGVLIPVDIDYLVESEPGVSLDVMQGLKETYGVAGAVFTHPKDPKERRYTVLIDADVADRAPAFYRFTLAEEFAHLVLHRSVIEGITSLEQAVALHRAPEYYDTLDRNAKRFAAAALMPAARIRQDAGGIFTALRAAKLDAETLTTKLTVQLAQRYGVSVVAMRHRLGEWPVNLSTAIQEAFARGLSRLP